MSTESERVCLPFVPAVSSVTESGGKEGGGPGGGEGIIKPSGPKTLLSASCFSLMVLEGLAGGKGGEDLIFSEETWDGGAERKSKGSVQPWPYVTHI